jgi:methyl-accepting chemotaxis protein
MKNLSLRRFLVITYTLIAAVVAVVTSGIAIYYVNSATNKAYTEYEDAMNQGYETEIKSQVQSCIAILQYYYDRNKSGELTLEQAQNEAKEAIRVMRYRDDESGYMWIDSTDYTLVMHPILPQNEGNNRYNLEDQNGVMIIQEIMKTADAGGGYNQFYFTKADGVSVALKVAYSEKFAPWGWVVTTGNYVDDMDREMADVKDDISSMSRSMVIMIVIVAVILIIVSIILSLVEGTAFILSPLKKIQQMADRMASGDISQDTDIKRMNEIGKTAEALNKAQDNTRNLVGQILNISSSINKAISDFEASFDQMSTSIGDVSTAVDDISQNIVTQADFTKNATDEVETIGKSIVDTEKEVNGLDDNAQQMGNLSDKSMKTLKELVTISDTTKEQIRNMYDQTVRTNDSVNKIKDAANMINDIAEQTDLLALNASIEAARAGESGKGFAVVAEQIANLARQSAENVVEIGDVVDELLTNSSQSLSIMDEMTEHIKKQFEYIYNTQSDFEQLSNSLKSCMTSVGSIDTMTSQIETQRQKIMSGLNKLNATAQDNAASIEETSAMSAELSEMVNSSNTTIHSLDEQMQVLMEDISKFKI